MDGSTRGSYCSNHETLASLKFLTSLRGPRPDRCPDLQTTGDNCGRGRKGLFFAIRTIKLLNFLLQRSFDAGGP